MEYKLKKLAEEVGMEFDRYGSLLHTSSLNKAALVAFAAKIEEAVKSEVQKVKVEKPKQAANT